MICTVQWVEVGTDLDEEELGVRVRYVNKRTPVSPFWPLYDHHQFSTAQAPIFGPSQPFFAMRIVSWSALGSVQLDWWVDKYVDFFPNSLLI